MRSALGARRSATTVLHRLYQLTCCITPFSPLPFLLYTPHLFTATLACHFFRLQSQEVHAFRGDRTFAAVAKDPRENGPFAVVRSLEWYGHQWTASANLSITCDKGPPIVCKGNARPEEVPFEITPRYLSDLRVPYNMVQQLPHVKEVKLVVILRHPTPRAWSAFFQTARPPMWRRHIFVDHVKEEVRLLRQCYNSSMAFSLLGAETPGHRPSSLSIDHVRHTSCREPVTAYVAFQRCVQAHVRDQEEPWFLKYTQAYTEMPRAFGVLEEAPFQGNVVRGLYVDQFVNLLCAGFDPRNILVLTQSRLWMIPAARPMFGFGAALLFLALAMTNHVLSFSDPNNRRTSRKRHPRRRARGAPCRH